MTAIPEDSPEAVQEQFWGRFDGTSAQLVKAKCRLREGTGTEQEVAWQRATLAAIRGDLAELGEHAAEIESGGE